MSFLARLMTFFIALWAALRLLRVVFLARRRPVPPPNAAPGGFRAPVSGGRMVRDRVCGMYVTRDTALTLDEGGETLYFCGSACRDAHRRGARAGA